MKEKLKGKSQWIVMGILEVLIGILLLVNPVYFTAGIVIAAGILLILAGLMNGYRYFRASPAVEERERTLALCLIGLVLGVLCVAGTRQVIAAFPVLTALYSVAILIGGFCKVQLTVDGIRNERKGWPALSAALSIAFAVVILCRPFSTTVAIWRFTGITLIVEAVVDVLTVLIGGRRAHNAEQHLRPSNAKKGNGMQSFYRKIVNHPRIILTVFVIAALCGAVLQGKVAVNYDMNDYLPPDSASTRALELLGEEFEGGIFIEQIPLVDEPRRR